MMLRHGLDMADGGDRDRSGGRRGPGARTADARPAPRARAGATSEVGTEEMTEAVIELAAERLGGVAIRILADRRREEEAWRSLSGSG